MEFKKLVGSFPRFYIPTTREEIDEILGPDKDSMTDEQKGEALLVRMKADPIRRMSSEYKGLVFQKISALLEYALVTETFKTFLKRKLDAVFHVGLPSYWDRKQTPDEFPEPDEEFAIDEEFEDQSMTNRKRFWPSSHDVVSILLDIHNPDSGGIFDPKRAKHLERVLYTVVEADSIDLWGGGPKGWLLDKIDALIARRAARVLPDIEDDSILRDKWRKEYRERYGKRLMRLPMPK